MAFLFAYDSFLDLKEMRTYCRGARIIMRAYIPDHRLSFLRLPDKKGYGVMELAPEKGSRVWGVLYRLELDDLVYLDKHLGVPDRHIRRSLDIVVENGSDVQAQVFLVNMEHGANKGDDHFRKACNTAREYGFPPEYVAHMEAMLQALKGKD